MRNERFARRATVGFTLTALALLPIGAAVASTGAAKTAATSGSAACALEELPLPDGAVESRVVDGDPTSQYLVGRHFGGQQWNAMLWVDGELEELTGPPSGQAPFVYDVSSSGVVVGNSAMPNGTRRAWIYADGEYTLLAGLDGASEVVPWGINARGDIVGYGRVDNTHHPLLWSAGQPDTVTELKAPESATALGISDDGVIVGNLNPLAQVATGYLWADADSAGTELTGLEGGVHTRALDIRGDWVGGMDGEGEDSIGVMWNIDSGAVESRDTTTPILEVNSAGDGANEQLTGTQFHADSVIVRADGTKIELPGLAEEGTQGVLAMFDRDGQASAAGYATDASGEEHAVVWRGC